MGIDFHSLDQLDRRLLFELDCDSRQGYRALARKLRSAQETIRYRVQRLVDHGVIFNFLSVIDAGKLQTSYNKVLLKLHNVDESKVEKIIRYLVEQEPVNWVARFDGLYDVSFTIRIRQIHELSDFVDEFRKKFSGHLQRLHFATNIEIEYLPRSYLVGKSPRSARIAPSQVYRPSPSSIDSIDRKILRILATNARASATQIGKELRLSSETIGLRIRKLEKSGVLSRYRIVLNNAALKQVNYYILLYLNYVSEKRLQAFIEYLRDLPRLVYFIKALGEWDYELNLEVENIAQYREIMMGLTREFSDIVRDYHGMPVSNVYKFTIAPALD